jgi:cbb3-type cytochrome oxidase subunit 3
MSLADIMSAAGLTTYAELALILCFITFVAIVVWVCVVRGRPSYEHQRQLPLDDESGATPHAAAKGGDL